MHPLSGHTRKSTGISFLDEQLERGESDQRDLSRCSFFSLPVCGVLRKFRLLREWVFRVISKGNHHGKWKKGKTATKAKGINTKKNKQEKIMKQQGKEKKEKPRKKQKKKTQKKTKKKKS